MGVKQYYTTREAASLLNISQSTVSRKFDRGLLSGIKNPITGKRMISRESIVAMLSQYNHPAVDSLFVEKTVLVASSNEELFSLFEKILSGRSEVNIERVESGIDVLLRCGKRLPDLLILDDEITGVRAPDIVRSLLKGKEDSPKIVYLSSGAEVPLDAGQVEFLDKDRLEEGMLRERILSILGIAEDREEQPRAFEHRRRWKRKKVDIPATLWVYRLSKPQQKESGKAVIKDISPGGAYLSNLELTSKNLPAEAFRILIEVDRSPLTGWRAHCRIVRLESSNGGLNAGVEFTRISKRDLEAVQIVTGERSYGTSEMDGFG